MSVEAVAEAVFNQFSELMDDPLLKVHARTLSGLADRVVVVTDAQVEQASSVLMALVAVAAESMTQLEELTAQRVNVQTSIAAAENDAEARRRIRMHLEAIENDPVELARDLRAVNRWLDSEAIDDRLAALCADEVDRVVMSYRVAARLVQTSVEAYRGLDVRGVLDTGIDHLQRSRSEAISSSLLHWVATLLGRAPTNERLQMLGPDHVRTLRAYLENGEQPIWASVQALSVLCQVLTPRDAADVVQAQLTTLDRKDFMFVRHAAIKSAVGLRVDARRKLELLSLARVDPSDHVRQGLADSLARWRSLEGAKLLAELCLDDPSEKVRAYALARFFDLCRALPNAFERLYQTCLASMKVPTPGAVPAELPLLVLCRELRTACHEQPEWLMHERFVEPLAGLLQNSQLPLGLAAELASLLVCLEVYTDPHLNELRRRLREALGELAWGETVSIDLPQEGEPSDFEKALSVAAYECEPIIVLKQQPGRCVVMRGESRRFAWWRFLFELRHPAPDKRQAFDHTSGRRAAGQIVTAPKGMAEVTKTNVPGERRVHDAVQGWGEFLPLVDDVLFCCGLWQRERRIVSSFGTLAVSGPKRLWQRLRTWFLLTLRYARYAELRERSLEAPDAASRRQFVHALEKLGVSVRVEHAAGQVHGEQFCRLAPTVQRYYATAAAFALPASWEGVFNEALSPTASSVWHLAVVVWLVFSLMVVRAAWIRRRIDRHRATMALSIGGWGSRGKSGTERLKAALFHALRVDAVVKTTGCEAMMIHARRDMPARELFVYRAYDRATIWEQAKILDYGVRLKATVFLWECMALRPNFVRLLQDEWMRDDFTTLTNAYPDHEDVMGPSGEDVARVIGTFSGNDGVVFTSESQMLPVLRAAAEKKGSRVVSVTDLDARLLPDDLLARFPYAEHPNNIALVLALAEHLGLEKDWTICKLAEHVVPDLGVLKTYPSVRYEGRTLTFSNGMSANERAGFVSNWRRLGFEKLRSDERPQHMVVTVVNNRADRVPRSRVFAELLTADAVADRLVLIGTNLITLERLLGEGTLRYVQGQSLEGALEDQAQLDRIFNHFRLPLRVRTTLGRLRLVLAASGCNAAEIDEVLSAHDAGGDLSQVLPPALELVRKTQAALQADDLAVPVDQTALHLEFLVAEHVRVAELREAVLKDLQRGALARAKQRLATEIKEMFMGRVTVVHDSHATGDQVIHQVALATPPGHQAHVLGCQNIKGTGLDFCYRWVSLGLVCQTLDRVLGERGYRAEGLQWLMSYPDYGLIDAAYVLDTLLPLFNADTDEWRAQRELLEPLLAQLRERVRLARTHLTGQRRVGLFGRVARAVEPFIDHLDSIRRARLASRIMQDLFANRIGQAHAARLLREVVARGKGGWLDKDLQRWFKRSS